MKIRLWIDALGCRDQVNDIMIPLVDSGTATYQDRLDICNLSSDKLAFKTTLGAIEFVLPRLIIAGATVTIYSI
jgi:hypothetical protein